jgi:conjugal transfer pilus assembly protein TraB
MFNPFNFLKTFKKDSIAKLANPNKDDKKAIFLLIAILILALVGYGAYVFMFDSSPGIQVANKGDHFIKIKDQTFTEEDNTTALTQHQSIIETLETQLRTQNTKIDRLHQSHEQQQKAIEAQTLIQEQLNASLKSGVKQDLADLPQPAQSANTEQPYVEDALRTGNLRSFGDDQQRYHQPMMGEAPVMQGFPNPFMDAEKEQGNPPKPYQRTWKNFVPTGTFCRAVLLGGADANAGVDSQGDAAPILFKVMSNCVLPNGKFSILKGAFITASVYGRISSERGVVRLDNLSYIHKDGHILDMPVEGTAFDVGGKNGIRGIPLLRNGKIIQMSGISGFLSGVGGALNQSSTTTSVSPLGATQSIDPSAVLKSGLGQGTQTALGKIADYYIKLAEQYSPIIQLNAGAMVDIVFLKGFPIEDEKHIERYEKRMQQSRTEASQAQNMPSIQNLNPLMQGLPKLVENPVYNKNFNQIAQDKLGVSL